VSEYVTYLKAKHTELEAQVKLLTTTLYYKDSVIRRMRAEIELLNSNKGT